MQAVSFAPDNLTINYGSKEDDERALQTLSELLTSAHQTQESFASEILRSLDIFSKVKPLLLVYALDSQGSKIFTFLNIANLWSFVQAELLSIKEKLLEEFSPDATCELGSQLTLNVPRKVCHVDFRSMNFVPKLINVYMFFFSLLIIANCDRRCYFQDASTIDDDFIYELFESQLKQSPRLSTEVPSLLSANQLLELVCDTFLALIHFVFIGLYYKLFSYQWYKIWHHTFECRFSTHPILLLGGFLYQLHLIRLMSIWLITVRYLWWESARCPDWWVTFRSKNVQQIPLYRITIMNWKIWIHLPMWTIRRYFLAFVSTFIKHICLQL